MAAPANKTIADLNGKWVMNKTLSDNPEPGLTLQGIGFLTRKAIGLATITLDTKQYDGDDGFVHVDIDQIASGGIKGTTELRVINGEPHEHSDWLFGSVNASSRWATAADLAEVAKEWGEHLVAGWLEGPEEQTGPNGASHVLNSVKAEAGWTATQVWGFQTIGGERRYSRNIVLKKGDKTVNLRLVYDYLP
ncbi:hypothetical protein BX600DRAFT_507784 [Xylariales sp. PMI_506]|nr:hypothetical protein BX600DRAFT_507784 [Xylariales sp. PMI_506]